MHRQHGAVHGHRHAHLVERDLVEEDLHVLDGVDGDARLADVADDARVVAVVAAVRRQVEGHREPHLPGGEVGPVEGVRLLGGGEARVLADGPRPVGVHRGPHAAEEGVEPGQRVDGFEAFEVGGGVERLHRDALRGVPHEGLGVPLQLLLREFFPVAKCRLVHSCTKATARARAGRSSAGLAELLGGSCLFERLTCRGDAGAADVPRAGVELPVAPVHGPSRRRGGDPWRPWRLSWCWHARGRRVRSACPVLRRGGVAWSPQEYHRGV